MKKALVLGLLILVPFPIAASNKQTQPQIKLSKETINDIEDYYQRFKKRAAKDLRGLSAKDQNTILDGLIAVKRLRRQERVKEAHEKTFGLQKSFPTQPLLMWHVAMSFYHQNAVVDEDDIPLRIKLLRQGRPFADRCLKLVPNSSMISLSE